MVEEQPDGEPVVDVGAPAPVTSSSPARPPLPAPPLPAPPLPAPPVTGDATVDEATAALVDLPELQVEDHPAVFEVTHRALTDRLADVEG